MVRQQLAIAITLFFILTIITGIIYPAAVTVVAQLVFPSAANGSIIYRDGTAVGSALIGQACDDPRYLWGRPSATAPTAYNAAASSGANTGPSSPALAERIRERIHNLRAVDPGTQVPSPVDLVTSSASGLDPHISPAAAYYQVPRIARLRKMPEEAVRQVIATNTQPPWLGCVGESVVVVLKANIDLDAYKK